MYKLKNDKFKKNRGGISRILAVCCEGCGMHLAHYQKDGPGILKRMYVDRFVDFNPSGDELKCQSCGRVLGSLINYKKENRPAYRLFVGAVNKRIVSAKDLLK